MSDEPGYAAGEGVRERVGAMMEFTPQGRALGLKLVEIDGRTVRALAPYRAEFVGDPDTGVIAGGVITTFLDQVCGLAVVMAMREPSPVATIDLRIDYMRAAEPGRDVLAEASCHKIGRNVAFVRAVAFEDAPANPIAHVTATFMVNAQAARKSGSNLRERKS